MKELISILICILLCGCSQEQPPTVEEYKSAIVATNIQFRQDARDEVKDSETMEYQRLFDMIYEKCIQTLQYDSITDKFSYSVYNLDVYGGNINSDVNGFQRDYENMISLNLPESTINNYVYSYAFNALQLCNVTEEVIEFSLDSDTTQLETNAELVQRVVQYIDKVLEISQNYSYVDDSKVWNPPSEKLYLGKGLVLPVTCDTKVNCFVRIDEVIGGSQAEEYVRGLSSTNAQLNFENDVIIIKYTIMNLSDRDVVYEDKIISVNKEGVKVTFNEKIIGLNSVIKLKPYEETTVTNIYVRDTSGSLIWFDNGAKVNLVLDIK